MPGQTVLICSTTYGGCGFVGRPEDFDGLAGEDLVLCPECGEDNCFQITRENIGNLTNEENYDKAHRMLNGETVTVG